MYYDSDCTNPAGFIEPYVVTDDNLDDNPLFSGDPFNVTEQFLTKKQSYAIELCLKVVRQVCYLNTYGFYISDFNLSNFATIKNNDRNIQMWDTDSFGYDTFFGKFFSQFYAESKNHPKYDTSTKEGAIDISNDALYQFVFYILSLGDSPISEHTGKFKYDNPNYFALIKKNFFPQNIWKHLETVFRGEKPPSAEALMQQLIITSNQLRQTPASDKSFKQLFIEVIPGYEEAVKQLKAEKDAENNYTTTSDTSGGPGKKSITKSNGSSSSRTSSTGGGKKKKSITKSNSSGSAGTSGTSGGTEKRSKTKSHGSGSARTSSTGRGIKKKFKNIDVIVNVVILVIAVIIGYYIYTMDSHGSVGNSGASTTGEISNQKDKSYYENIDYIGWSENDAVSDIKAAGWKAKCVEMSSWTKKKGLVTNNFYTKSNKTITLYISSGPNSPDDVKHTGANITVNKTDIVLSKGQTIELTVTASGDCPERYHFSYERGTNIEAKWGEWIDHKSAVITFTGKSSSDTGYVRFRIFDFKTKEALGYTDIFITVQ